MRDAPYVRAGLIVSLLLFCRYCFSTTSLTHKFYTTKAVLVNVIPFKDEIYRRILPTRDEHRSCLLRSVYHQTVSYTTTKSRA
ncbi:hypothetical protein F5146DRAFT_1067799 [Armillaria mellea]|nr:hypothetical protein F5146DRAFT_1067799 [Armillaria mellea]